LAEIDAGVIPVGKIIRRERLYSSHINVWRKEIAKTRLKALAPKARGPKPKVQDPLAIENIALRKQAAKLEKKLRKAEMIIEFQKSFAVAGHSPSDLRRGERREESARKRDLLMTTLSTRPEDLGVRECCEALSVPRATHYRLEAAAARRNNAAAPSTAMIGQPHFRALSEEERAGVLEVLVSKRFCDDALRQVYSTLLDEGQYHCSI
jgi:hypothetical protein